MNRYDQLQAGSMTTLCGVSGSGKTRQCLSYAEAALSQQQPVVWIDGDQNYALNTSFYDHPKASLFWGFEPSGFDQAYQLALAFCRLKYAGLVVIDSLDGLLPDRFDQQRVLRRSLPKLIGAVYASKSRLVCTVEPNSRVRSSALQIYSQTIISLGVPHVD